MKNLSTEIDALMLLNYNWLDILRNQEIYTDNIKINDRIEKAENILRSMLTVSTNLIESSSQIEVILSGINSVNHNQVKVSTSSGNRFADTEFAEMQYRDDNSLIGTKYETKWAGAGHLKKAIGDAKLIGNIAEDGIDLLEEFGKHVPDKISKGIGAFKKITSLFSDMYEAGESIASIAGAETGISIAEASGIIAGAESIAAAGTVLGPVGWAVGAGVLATAGIASAKEDSDRILHRQMQLERQKHASLQTFVMSGEDADKYINSTSEDKKSKWHTEFNRFTYATARYGKNANDINIPIPLAVLDNTAYMNPINAPKETLPQTMQVKESFLQKTNSLTMYLVATALTEGMPALNEKIAQERKKMSAGKHNKEDKDQMETAIKLAKAQVVHAANGDRDIHNNDGSINYTHTGKRRTGSDGEGKRIVININKPLIEYFTVNTKDVKEGIGDFKHKVEEVLLEILNSANAIN